MAKEKHDWKKTLASIQMPPAAAALGKPTMTVAQFFEKINENQREAITEFVREGRVVSYITGQLNWKGTREAIALSGLHVDIEDLIEQGLRQGNLLEHEGELFDVFALIRFVYAGEGSTKDRRARSKEDIKQSLRYIYPWIEQENVWKIIENKIVHAASQKWLFEETPGHYSLTRELAPRNSPFER